MKFVRPEFNIARNFMTMTRLFKIFPYLLLLILVESTAIASEAHETASEVPQQCSTNCISDYGEVLGKSPAGVRAYSNCNSNCVIFEPNYLDEIYTGIKWQCVEYARRWLLHERGVVFGDVDIAADIWGLEHVENPITKRNFNFTSVVNGAETIPQRGDLLIYSKEFLGTGHVAVVTAVDEGMQVIRVAEQNYANTAWESLFAREIRFIKVNSKVWLLDSYLVGWKRVEFATLRN